MLIRGKEAGGRGVIFGGAWALSFPSEAESKKTCLGERLGIYAGGVLRERALLGECSR